MELLPISFLAGILTVLAPCVLPLLPVILGSSLQEEDKWRPWIITFSLAISIIVFTLLLKFSTAFIGISPMVLQLFSGGIVLIYGLVTLFPTLWEKLSLKLNFANSSNELLQKSSKVPNKLLSNILIGMALGPVFSSCSPTYFFILANVLPLDFNIGLANLVAYGLGLAVIMLAVALLGQKLIKKLNWIADPHGKFKKFLGILLIIVGVAVITGFDKHLQTYILDKGYYNVSSIEQKLLDQNIEQMHSGQNGSVKNQLGGQTLTINEPYPAPEVRDIQKWFNSNGETLEDLKGKVVLIDFWTYSCINCIRTIPYLNDWHQKYADDGLVILGLHAPEFAFEKVEANVQKAVEEYGIAYPVGMDNNFSTWRAYENRYWPAKYFIDREGNLRHYHFGEGEYKESEIIIQELLKEDGSQITGDIDPNLVNEPPIRQGQSPETYLGFARAENNLNSFATTANKESQYELQNNLKPNEWSLGGRWLVSNEDSTCMSETCKLNLNFSAKEVYLVMGSENESQVEVRLNGQLVDGANEGLDALDGEAKVKEYKLYRLINLSEFAKNQMLELTFKKGVKINAFTFGS